jgi:hypothetical protein
MLYKAKAALFSEIRTKHSKQSEHHVEFLNVKPVVRKETARLQKVKSSVKKWFVSVLVFFSADYYTSEENNHFRKTRWCVALG